MEAYCENQDWNVGGGRANPSLIQLSETFKQVNLINFLIRVALKTLERGSSLIHLSTRESDCMGESWQKTKDGKCFKNTNTTNLQVAFLSNINMQFFWSSICMSKIKKFPWCRWCMGIGPSNVPWGVGSLSFALPHEQLPRPKTTRPINLANCWWPAQRGLLIIRIAMSAVDEICVNSKFLNTKSADWEMSATIGSIGAQSQIAIISLSSTPPSSPSVHWWLGWMSLGLSSLEYVNRTTVLCKLQQVFDPQILDAKQK